MIVMETSSEIIAKCILLGHEMRNDPPFLGGTRFTCIRRHCGRAVVHASGGTFWYGSALTTKCTHEPISKALVKLLNVEES